MGEMADMILEGEMCEQCGVFLVVDNYHPPGHPCCCKSCAEDPEIAEMYKGRIKQEI